MRGVFLRPVIAVTLVLAACDGATPPPVEPVACSLPYPAPAGWEAGATNRAEQGGHVGVEQVFTRGQDVLVYSAGMLRDQFEEGPVQEGIPLSGGEEASLFAFGEEVGGKGWTLFWYGPEPCKQYAIDGAGMSRATFVRALEDAGVLGPEG